MCENDASLSTSREILNKLLNLKSIAKDINPDCDVSLSIPTMRTDRGKEALTVSHLTNHLLQLQINVIDKRNITGKRLSRWGLYLHVSGCNQLAKNFLEKIKTFWEGKGCSGTDDNNSIFVEISIRKKNWLLCCSYNPYKSNISTHMHHLSKGLYIYINKYDNILFLGDFNSETSENYLDDFCNVYNLRNIVTEPTCFKNPENPSCIDLFLINRPRCFQNRKIWWNAGILYFQ